MTRTRRMAVGALIGALFMLLVHPSTRDYVWLSARFVGRSDTLKSSPFVHYSFDVLPAPKTAVESSLWMQIAGETTASLNTLEEPQVQAMFEVAQKQASVDPENAFWRQCAAVFQDQLGHKDEAGLLWSSAANCLRWNDFQVARIELVRADLQRSTASPMSWQAALGYWLVTDSTSQMIESFGRRLVQNGAPDRREELNRRSATLLNGVLLRDGARRVSQGRAGANLIEFASYPRVYLEQPSPRVLLLARNQLIDDLRSHGWTDRASAARRAFASNDAWIALVTSEDAQEMATQLSVLSVLTATAPSALLIVSLGAFLVGATVSKSTSLGLLDVLLRAPLAQLLGVAASVVLYLATSLPLVAVVPALGSLFLGVDPAHARTQPPNYFGPFFRFTVGVLAVVFGCLCSLFLAGLSTPAVEVLPLVGVPPELFGGNTLPLGLALLAACLLLLVGPSWALVLRIPTLHVTKVAIREFFTILSWGCFLGGLVTVLLCVLADSYLLETLSNLSLNEPNYYLLK